MWFNCAAAVAAARMTSVPTATPSAAASKQQQQRLIVEANGEQSYIYSRDGKVTLYGLAIGDNDFSRKRKVQYTRADLLSNPDLFFPPPRHCFLRATIFCPKSS